MSTGCPPPLRAHGPPFICSRSYPQVAMLVRAKMAKDCAYKGRTVLSYLLLTAGDKGIKCPSGSPEQCRSGPLGAPPFATMAILSALRATARLRLRGASPCAFGRTPERRVGRGAGVQA